MPLDSAGLAAAHSEERSDAWLWLLEVTHADLAAPVRLTSNAEPVTKTGGEEFLPAPFEIDLGDEVEDRPPAPKIVVQDLNDELRVLLRSMTDTDPPLVTVELVLASDVDTPQFRQTGLQMAGDITYGPGGVTEIPLSHGDGTAKAFPGELVTPSTVPAAFL